MTQSPIHLMARIRVEPAPGCRPPTTQAARDEIGNLIIAVTSSPPSRRTSLPSTTDNLAVGCNAHPLQRRFPRP